MGRVYATDENGVRFLRYIECDRCPRRAAPGSDELLKGGWTKKGQYVGPGSALNTEWHLCPDHSGGG